MKMPETPEMPDEIVLWPDERLSQSCEEITVIDDEIKTIAANMLRDMYATDGVGLAAPQIGIMKRMVVIDVDYPDGQENPFVLINPVVVAADGEPRTYREGCLSFPGITVPVMRPSHVIVQALNLDGDLMQYEAEGGLFAVCLQHEIDHVNGITMPDHLGPGARIEVLRHYQEALAAGAKPGDTTFDEE